MYPSKHKRAGCSLGAELRSDPITRSWVHVGHAEDSPTPADGCPLCPGRASDVHVLLELPAGGMPQVRVFPHFRPLYQIEGATGRVGDGVYDRMRPVGAHEIIVESPDHNDSLARMNDEQIRRILDVYALRIRDLKGDPRFRYITVFENHGALSGAEWKHPYSEVIATVFVPPRVLYELRSARAWYEEKERCVFCDVLRQEERQGRRVVDAQGDYIAVCPYASRVPFELWVMPRLHSHLFEQMPSPSVRHDLAALLGRVLRRLAQIAESYHLVLHTAPSTTHQQKNPPSYWLTLAEDFHWHIEILPIVEQRRKSYSIKEVYFNALLPEEAAQRLRQMDPQA
jgi:UDPglucose--hexose-1-phosphate uridylyltransferase